MPEKNSYILDQLGQDALDDVISLERLTFTTPWSKEQYARLMDAGLCKIFGALAGERVVAYAAVSVSVPAGELEIYNIAVHPEHRRQGLARRVTGLILEAGAKLGLERAVLEVRAGNVAARGLYEGLGFKECGLRPAYYTSPDEDAVLYEYCFE